MSSISIIQTIHYANIPYGNIFTNLNNREVFDMKKENNKFPLSLIIYVITLTAVNAVLYTPALPELTKQMGITQGEAQYTIAFFLIGYALAQIVFGITANFFR